MHSTVAQNKAHRNDIKWIKTKGSSFKVEIDGRTENYISEYLNPFTGQAIRKDWRMTGADWHVFNADGTRPKHHRWGTLTVAKHYAANPL